MTASILLVDDDAVQAGTRQEILLRSGENVYLARNAREALDCLRKPEWFHSVGLVITDHLMPGMNGPEFVTELRAILPDVPVLVLSGLLEAEALYNGLDVIFRVKPFAPDKLISLVRALVGHSQRRSA